MSEDTFSLVYELASIRGRTKNGKARNHQERFIEMVMILLAN